MTILASQTRRCHIHDCWLVLDERHGPSGPFKFWKCPVVNCPHCRPAKYAAGTRRDLQAAKRGQRAEQIRLFPGEVIELNRHIDASASLTRPKRNIAPGFQGAPAATPVDADKGFPPQTVVSQVNSARGAH